MERMNSQPESMIPGAAHGLLDLQGSMQMHHLQRRASFDHYHHHQLNQADTQGTMAHTQMHDAVRPPSPKDMQECSWLQPGLPIMDYNKRSDEDDRSFNVDDGTDGYGDSGKGKKGAPWLRMKWTDGMVRLLINAVSYIDEDAFHECLRRRLKSASICKNRKWKSISKVMAERGCCVSPQQCEDKFNDLNKRYKRLTDILGRGTSCKVVENPSLLDLMDHLTDKAKDEVRKILCSKQLFYEEMCSLHNCNRLHLPDDPALQKSLHSALRNGDDDEMMGTPQDVRGGNQGGGTNDLEGDIEENSTLQRDIGSSGFQKRIKLVVDSDQMALGKSSGSQVNNKSPQFRYVSVDMNQVFPEGSISDNEQKWLKSRSVQLEEQRWHIQTQMMELERQHFKWLRFAKKKDRELDEMRIEIEKMKLHNEKMRLELKRKELDINLN